MMTKTSWQILNDSEKPWWISQNRSQPKLTLYSQSSLKNCYHSCIIIRHNCTELLKLIKHYPPYFDKMYLYVKYPFESKYQLLINGREAIAIENEKYLKAFIDYLEAIDDVYENSEDHYPTKKRKVLKLILKLKWRLIRNLNFISTE